MARRQAAATSWALRVLIELSKNHTGAPGGTRTRVAALRVRYPCRWTTSARFSVGSEGLEPSPGGLRVRCAAANTLIPFFHHQRAHHGRGGNRTLDLTLIRGLLSPLSYAPVGSKGLEPSPPGLKVRYAAVTPRPRMQVGRIRFPCVCFMFVLLVSSGSPESRTQRHPVISRVWATGPRLPILMHFTQSGWQDSNLRSRAPKARGLTTALHPVFQSERPDSNRRSPGPRPGAIPSFATFCVQ